jgi:hypothetical protein
MNKKATILTLVGVLGLCGTAAAKKLHVPGQYATIQAGIDAAVDGDEVIVGDGTYTGEGNRDIDFLGKPITVRSENGPENCIIDCNGTEAERHRGFRFDNNEDANSVVDGFTIINGYAPEKFVGGGWRSVGGAIMCVASSPMVKNCVISDNTSEYGASISCEESGPTITNCTIRSNSALVFGGAVFCRPECSPTIASCTIIGNSAGVGGAILCYESDLAIADCTISGNTSESDGGAITFYRGNVTIENCVISSNTAEAYGGGMYCWDSNVTIMKSEITGNSARVGGGIYTGESARATDMTIIDCTIRANASSSRGGGIYCDSGSPTIINSTISGNTAGSGGGIWCDLTRALITNCVISGNSARGSGGGVFFMFSIPTIENSAIIGNKAAKGAGILFDVVEAIISNCTISENIADSTGGGIWGEGVYATMTNAIIWNNSTEQITMESGTILATYSDVQDSWPGVGNIDADPWFVEPGYWDANGTPQDANDDFWVEGDYRLLEGSPCIDTGDPNYQPEPNETDLDGNPRLVDGNEDGAAVVDMGAYEYTPPVEVEMTLLPRTVNCGSKGKSIKAHITLPEEFSAEDVDVDEPVVAEPMDVESQYIKLIGHGEGPARLEVGFDREAFCEAVTEGGEVEVTVVGWLTSGREFYGTDTIKIIHRR